jgi:dihydrofolate reductase
MFDEPYYDSLNELPKIVFSSTLEDPLGWRNSTVLHEDAVTAIERLKRTTDVPMRSHGSISLNRALLAAGLVDRLEILMFPAVSGRAGEALFHDGAGFDLELIESTVLDGRTQRLVYIRSFTARSPRVSGRSSETRARCGRAGPRGDLRMQYLVNVIGSRSNSGTADEAVATDTLTTSSATPATGCSPPPWPTRPSRP